MLETMSNCHVWGCPINVLEPKLHNPGVKNPKFYTRSQIGIYIGFIKMYSKKYVLVLRLVSGSISTQYHVVFDKMFMLWRLAHQQIQKSL